MYYHEEQMNLLSVPQGYMLAHCISGDYALGAGIAKQIDQAFGMKDMLKTRWRFIDYDSCGPICLTCANVYNLVTKPKFWNKPTLGTLREALLSMRRNAETDGVKKIAMPKIGCGLDRLNWEDVKKIIMEIFDDMDVEILVCYL